MKHKTGHIMFVLTVALLTSPLLAQSQWKVPDRIKPLTMFVKSPVFPDLKDTPELPRVLIVGDSISMQYTPEVRRLLAGKANVYRIPDNGQTTAYGLAQLEYWLGDGHWAVIHFNFGLHDIHMAKGHVQQVMINDYEKNLRQLVKQLQATRARLIWASTTPVPSGLGNRQEADVLGYNAIARTIMGEYHIPIDDLHASVQSWGDKGADWQLPHNVHFRAEGYTEMATEVAKYILAALNQ